MLSEPKTQPKKVIGTTGLIQMGHSNAALQAALAKAQGECRTIAKEKTQEQRRYKYSSAEEIIRGTRKPLSDNGLAIITTWKPVPVEVPIEQSIGNQFVGATVKIDWILTHAEGGYLSGTCEMDAICSSARPTDKAVAATLTYATGFLLRGLLNLDREEEPAEESPDQRHDNQFQPRQQQRQQAPQPRSQQQRPPRQDAPPKEQPKAEEAPKQKPWQAYLLPPMEPTDEWYTTAYRTLVRATGCGNKTQWETLMNWLGVPSEITAENVMQDPTNTKAVYEAIAKLAQTVNVPEMMGRAEKDAEIAAMADQEFPPEDAPNE